MQNWGKYMSSKGTVKEKLKGYRMKPENLRRWTIHIRHLSDVHVKRTSVSKLCQNYTILYKSSRFKQIIFSKYEPTWKRLWNYKPPRQISESLQWNYKPLGRISESPQWNYKPLGRIPESLQWNYKPLGRMSESLQWN